MTILNSDAVTYVGPISQASINFLYPRWMYNPVYPPRLVINMAEENALIVSQTGWTTTYQPPYPQPSSPPQSIAAMVPSGIIDNFKPTGSIPGITSHYELMPTDATSALAGFVAANDGWTIEIFNPHPTLSLPLLNRASAVQGNSFVLGNFPSFFESWLIPPQGGSWFMWLVAVYGWMPIG
jgi:hypothetical protein